MAKARLTITLDQGLLKKLDREIDGHKFRNRSHIIENFLSEKLGDSILRKALILGGGQGIEIDGKDISKLLLPVEGNKTLIEYNIEVLKKYGITDIIISTGDYGDQLRDKLGDGSKYGVKMVYFEKDNYGTGSALRRSKTILKETFLMMNGDILLKGMDIEDMYDFHKNNKGVGTILLTSVEDPNALGQIVIKGNKINDFHEKKDRKNDKSHIINAGVYLFEPEVCFMTMPESAILEKDVFPKLAKEGKLFGYNLDEKWIHLHDNKLYDEYKNSIKA